jgi:hypothetical protein
MPIAKITSDRNQANLLQDLKRYCQYAVGLGADEARVVDVSTIRVEDAVACPRITDMTLAAGPGGDASRSVGYVWTMDGRETLYLRSRTVLDARAAGIHFPTINSWLDTEIWKASSGTRP